MTQRHVLRCALHAWGSATHSAAWRRATGEKLLNCSEESPQAQALHAWRLATRCRMQTHTALRTACAHFRRVLMYSCFSNWRDFACCKAKSVKSLGRSRKRMHSMHVGGVLDTWKRAIGDVVFERKMLPVAELQRQSVLAAQAFQCFAAVVAAQRTRAQIKCHLQAISDTSSAGTAFALWRSCVQHRKKQQNLLEQFKSVCSSRTLVRAFNGWRQEIETMSAVRIAVEASLARKRKALLLQVLRSWHACASAIKSERNSMYKAVTHSSNRYIISPFADLCLVCRICEP
jgi:hypothetical protein